MCWEREGECWRGRKVEEKGDNKIVISVGKEGEGEGEKKGWKEEEGVSRRYDEIE
jgi:hypothetical protein